MDEINQRPSNAVQQHKPNGQFAKGNTLAKGGRRNPPGGRRTNAEIEARKLATEIAREYIEKNIKQIMETYVALATGGVVKKGRKEFRLEVNPKVTMDAVSKFVPARAPEDRHGEAQKTYILQTNINIEEIIK